MSKKIINLGKVKAKTKELRLNGKIIEHKYDDETEWQELVDLKKAGSSITTVSDYSELPAEAIENDVAIVENEEYVRTESKTIVLPVEIKAPVEDAEIPNIYSIKFKDSFGTLLDNEELKDMGVTFLNASLEFEYQNLMYADMSAEVAQAMAGVNHPVRVIQYSDAEEQMSFYVEGMSIKDFLSLMMELELEEDQWAVLLGSHANDSSADNPSYGWVNLVLTNEPINENSLDFGGMYGTLVFDADAPEINDMLGYIGLSAMDANMESVFEIGANIYSYDSWSEEDAETQSFILKYANLMLNNMANGGTLEQSNDIYNPKGLFQNDNGEWVSLEEKMNTPRFVDVYADLPKTSIENGMMAVAKESIYESEPTETTALEMYKSYRLKAVDEITTDTINSIVESVLPNYPTDAYANLNAYLMDLEKSSEINFSFAKGNGLSGVTMYFNIDENTQRRILYLAEIPEGMTVEDMGFFAPVKGSDAYPEFAFETGKWFWADIYDGNDGYYTVDGVVNEGLPLDSFSDNILFGGGSVEFDSEAYPTDNGESYKDFTNLDTLVFHFEDLSSFVTTTYPAGFYRYNNNEWIYIKDVSGGNFENEDILRSITAENIGNIQENTVARHTHDNKGYLDQISNTTLSNIASNTSARHEHKNLSILDTLKQEHLHSHENKDVLDGFGYYKTDKPYYTGISTLRYNGVPLSVYDVIYTSYTNKPSLAENTVTYLSCYYSSYEVGIPYGHSWIQMSIIGEDLDYRPFSEQGASSIKFNTSNIYWKDDLFPDLYAASSIYLHFYTTGSGTVFAEWFNINKHFDRPDTRLLPKNANYKFARVTNGVLEYAPMMLGDTLFPPRETYIKSGYKMVTGDNPYEVYKKMAPDDECEMRYVEYDDVITVYWIVSKKGERIGEFINSSLITDWSRWFQNSGSNISDYMIGQIDTSKGDNFTGMFIHSKFTELSLLDLRKASAVSSMFSFSDVKTIRTLKVDGISCNGIAEIFSNSKVENVTFEGTVKVISNFGVPTKFTVDSVVSLFNAFEDNTGEETQYKIIVTNSIFEQLTDEQKDIVENKNLLLINEGV